MGSLMPQTSAILPGATLGMLGGGQLGRFFVLAARQMGYRVLVVDPDPKSPGGALADEFIVAAYDDQPALERLAAKCAAVTTEFENVPAAALEFLEGRCVVAPSARCVAIAQHRMREKRFLKAGGFPVAPWAAVEGAEDIPGDFRYPAILKRASQGYDGRGQVRVANLREARAAWAQLGRVPCVLEAELPLDCELSVVLARSRTGEVRAFDVAENRHQGGILDTTVVPARIERRLAAQAVDMACRIAAKLDYVGVLAVEFFVSHGLLVVNELAPRPHNSGHYTIEACASSQFEQQVRALCGLPLGDPRLLSAAAMLNVLGESFQAGEPRWDMLLATEGTRLHLYGKAEARRGRKMGHVTVLAADAGAAAEGVEACRARLGGA